MAVYADSSSECHTLEAHKQRGIIRCAAIPCSSSRLYSVLGIDDVHGARDDRFGFVPWRGATRRHDRPVSLKMILTKKRKEPEELERSPTITKRIEQKQVEERLAIGANVVHETIRREGEEELKRSASALAWSGLAAGLSMGFSLVAEALFVAYLPDQP
jgi:hypothetical protein